MIGVWILIGVNSLMIITFLNADLERSVEADSKNQIHQNNKDYFNRQGHLVLPFLINELHISAMYLEYESGLK
jgi:hypothetical protein